MSSDPIRAALERLVRMHEAPRDEYEYYDAMTAARAALAAAPEGEGPSMPAAINDMPEAQRRWYALGWRAAIASMADPFRLEPEPVAAPLEGEVAPATPPAPLEGEVGELVAKLRRLSPQNPLGTADPTITRAAALLQQLSADAPAVAPVAVSERLPGDGDCDAEGRCWLFSKVESEWRLIDAGNPGVPHLKYCFSHWLPAHALPLPAPQGGEVEGDGPAVPESREPASVAPEATGPRPLSPAAQAVLDAAVLPCTIREGIAAALRAVADQAVPEAANAVGDEHDEARLDQWLRIRWKLLAIAAELEGQP